MSSSYSYHRRVAARHPLPHLYPLPPCEAELVIPGLENGPLPARLSDHCQYCAVSNAVSSRPQENRTAHKPPLPQLLTGDNHRSLAFLRGLRSVPDLWLTYSTACTSTPYVRLKMSNLECCIVSQQERSCSRQGASILVKHYAASL